MLTVDVHSHMAVEQFGRKFETDLRFNSVETPDGRLIEFTSQIPMGQSPRQTAGRVVDGQLELEVTTSGKTARSSIPWKDEYGGPYAVPLSPSRAAEVVALAVEVDRLTVVIDAEEAVEALETTQRRSGSRTDAMLKVDCGYHRAGVDPSGDRGLALARRMTDSAGVRFRGVLAHGGHSYSEVDPPGIRAVAAEERDVIDQRRNFRRTGDEQRHSAIDRFGAVMASRDANGHVDSSDSSRSIKALDGGFDPTQTTHEGPYLGDLIHIGPSQGIVGGLNGNL